MTGRIFKFESFATFEGEGIRCGVFTAGCPLRCVYCHNPEGWDATGGEEISAEALAAKIMRFKPYFGKNGGVTFTGGEPLLQARFLSETARILKKEGVSIAVDTSGCVFGEDARQFIGLCDLAICDLKFPDKEGYIRYTGADVFQTVCEFLDFVAASQKRLWLRTVIVPGINDRLSDLDEYISLARRWKPEKYELAGFHTLGFSKYTERGLFNPLSDTQPMSEDKLRILQSYLDKNLFI